MIEEIGTLTRASAQLGLLFPVLPVSLLWLSHAKYPSIMLAQKQIHGLSQCKQEKSSANCPHGCHWLGNCGTFRNISLLWQDYLLRLIPETEVRPVFSSIMTFAVSMLKKCGNKGRWVQCCLLSAGGPGQLPTANHCSKYGWFCLGGLMLCCDSIYPSRVYPIGIPIANYENIFYWSFFPDQASCWVYDTAIYWSVVFLGWLFISISTVCTQNFSKCNWRNWLPFLGWKHNI